MGPGGTEIGSEEPLRPEAELLRLPDDDVIVDGQPMCLQSFGLTNYNTPVWAGTESSAGSISVKVNVSVAIQE